MKKIIVSVMLGIVVAAFVAGCNTVRGAGQDIERTGEAVTDVAR